MPENGGKRPKAGRPKGTPNKVNARTREDLWAYIEQKCAQGHNANPFHVLVDEMVAAEDRRLAVQCADILADRLLPKLKAIEHDVADELKKVIVHRYGRSRTGD